MLFRIPISLSFPSVRPPVSSVATLWVASTSLHLCPLPCWHPSLSCASRLPTVTSHRLRHRICSRPLPTRHYRRVAESPRHVDSTTTLHFMGHLTWTWSSSATSHRFPQPPCLHPRSWYDCVCVGPGWVDPVVSICFRRFGRRALKHCPAESGRSDDPATLYLYEGHMCAVPALCWPSVVRFLLRHPAPSLRSSYHRSG